MSYRPQRPNWRPVGRRAPPPERRRPAAAHDNRPSSKRESPSPQHRFGGDGTRAGRQPIGLAADVADRSRVIARQTDALATVVPLRMLGDPVWATLPDAVLVRALDKVAGHAELAALLAEELAA